MEPINNEDAISQITISENNLYNQLEVGSAMGTLTMEKKENIVKQLTQLNNIRIKLYENMNDTQQFYNNNLESATDTLSAQNNALKIVYNEIINSEDKLKNIEQSNNNNYRLVEINEYYTQQYNNNIKIMKILIFYLFCIYVVISLNRRGILSEGIYNIALIFVLFMAILQVGMGIYDAYQRSNMYYNEYNFSPPPRYSTSNSLDGGFKIPKFSLTEFGCVDQSCCPDGYTYSSVENKCIKNTN